jgi:hypothetical protein
MTGGTMRDLLKPLIGKSGSMSMLVSRIGQVAFPTAEDKPLTGVEARPDGLIRLERETGWTVIDPREVVAVVWHGDRGNARPDNSCKTSRRPPTRALTCGSRASQTGRATLGTLSTAGAPSRTGSPRRESEVVRPSDDRPARGLRAPAQRVRSGMPVLLAAR